MKIFDSTVKTDYLIDGKGNIYSRSKSTKAVRQVKPNINNKRGYLYARTKNKNWQIHRLVAEFYLKNPKNKPCVNHKDGDKHNNCVGNLEWVTHKENSRHAVDTGLLKVCGKNDGANLKYTYEQIKEVYKRCKLGMTYVQAGSIFNMPYSTVAHLIRGSRRKIYEN